MIWKFWKPSCRTALLGVMRQVGVVGKHDRNEDSDFSFRGIDAVVNSVYPALLENSVLVTPRVLEYHTDTVQVGTGRTVSSHATLVMEYTWRGPRGDKIVTSAAGEALDFGDKATSKASSVAFRTALLQALSLPTGERDPDADTYTRSQPEKAATAPERREFSGTVDDANTARAELLTTLEPYGWTQDSLANRYKLDYRANLLRADAEAVRGFLSRLRNQEEAAR